MNKSKMDSMFREKLHGHKVTPGPEAWTKLKGNLDSDRKKALLIYWRVAAVIILLLTTVFFLYKIKGTGLQDSVAGKQEQVVPKAVKEKDVKEIRQDNKIAAKPEKATAEPKNTEGVAKDNRKPAEAEASTERKTLTQEKTADATTIAAAPTTENQEKSGALTKRVRSREKSVVPEAGEIKKQPLIDMVESIAPKTLHSHETTHLASVTASNKQREGDLTLAQDGLPNITITFKKDAGDTAEEAVANDQELGKVKKFAFKKFISLAKDIKAGEVAISTLKGKKDELLAFNFNKKRNVKNSK